MNAVSLDAQPDSFDYRSLTLQKTEVSLTHTS